MSPDAETKPPAEVHRAIEELARSAFGNDARVIERTALAGDASSRRYERIRLAAPAPPSAVLMIQSGSGLSVSSDELAVFARAPREMPFLNVQRYLREAGIAVPEVYAAAHDLVLLEDVGDETLFDAARARGPALYQKAIDELVRLQAAGERRPEPSCLAFQQRFDARLFLWEFDHFLEYGFADRGADPADLRALRVEFAALAEELGAERAVLTHRDYHGWNLFVHEHRVRVIDFQDALLAPAPYDLATLLNDRATPSVVTPAVELELVAYFLERRGEGETLDAFLPRYHRFVFQKALKVLGRFIYLEDVKGKRGYRAMLPDTIATVRRSLEGLPELAGVRRLIAKSFPEIG